MFLDENDIYNLKLVALGIVFIILGRIGIIFVLGFLVGIWNKFETFPIPFRQWIILYWSGIPRGILSYALMTTLKSHN